ncbi:MAG: hypothetical protein OEZ21_11460 [Candidatus Bathyarchaeota archaeon]|nr:hypothetical protein [Candidatus Bathyarchaeota archaeon]MDH5747549.1 hypothetical protein [Candidatus Bathyarchaeota archaeon]
MLFAKYLRDKRETWIRARAEVGPADFVVTVVQAYVIGKNTYYIPLDMQLDETEQGTGFGIKRPSYTIMIVSSISEEGFVDYEFKADSLYGRF